MTEPFQPKDCNLSLISMGKTAENLVEMRDQFQKIPTSSIYYHFWGGRLRLSFVHPEYHNDFAHWAHFALHDEILTERLAIVDPTEYPEVEELRKKVLEIIEARIGEVDSTIWCHTEWKFHFLRSIIIVSNMGAPVNNPPELKGVLPRLTHTSVFYHFIDARRRTPNRIDDFSTWLSTFGSDYEDLSKKIQLIDPYFLSLSEIREKLVELLIENL